MSQKVNCKVAPSDYLRITRASKLVDDQMVAVTVYEDGDIATIDIPRSEFLAAVAAELDAVVIDREEFPEVELKGDWIVSNGAHYETLSSVNGPDEIRREATEMLAIAEFLETNPPVDEEQVAAIAVALADARLDTDGRNETWFTEEARRLYRAGVRVGGDDK